MKYKNNKYTIWYYNIISLAKARNLDKTIYTEKHHIIPKSLGGNNSSDNLATLTAREHFVCHLLLVKMTDGINRSKMIHAAWRMTVKSNNTQIRYIANSRQYSYVRSLYISQITNRVVSKETREKLRNANLGKTASIEAKAKMSASRKGVTYNDRYDLNTADILRAKKSVSAQGINKNNTYRLGKLHTADTKLKMSKSQVRVKQQCVYCNKEIDLQNFTRYHGDKCKLNPIVVPRKTISCKYCDKQVDPANYARYHGDKCKYKS